MCRNEEAQRGFEIIGTGQFGALLLFGWLFHDRCLPRCNQPLVLLAYVDHYGQEIATFLISGIRSFLVRLYSFSFGPVVWASLISFRMVKGWAYFYLYSLKSLICESFKSFWFLNSSSTLVLYGLYKLTLYQLGLWILGFID